MTAFTCSNSTFIFRLCFCLIIFTFQDFRNPVLAPYKVRGGGGGGAPIRSASGRLITSYHDDPILSFNDPNRYHVDNDLRYKRTKEQQDTYRKELDQIVAEKQNEQFRYALDVCGYLQSEFSKILIPFLFTARRTMG